MTRLDSIQWACYLGANTAKRLAAEWSLDYRTAAQHLRKARACGLLRASPKNAMGELRYSLPKLLDGMEGRR